MHNFWENDEFSLISMSLNMQDIFVPPARIGSMGLFQMEGVTTTTVSIEKQGNTLNLIPTAARGTMPEYKSGQKPNLRAIGIPHLPKNDAVIADSVQNVRGFGTDNLEAVATVVANKLAALKADHETTWEYHRIGALQGKVLDADGTTEVYDLHSLFGVSRQTITWDTTDISDMRVQVAVALEDAMDDALFGASWTGIHVFCSEGFWAELIASTEIGDAYKSFQSRVNFAADQTRQPFNFAGINFERLRGKVGSVKFVPDDEAFAIPLGTSGLFKQFNAPGTFEDTVNTVGLPYYARQEPMKFGTGRELHTQSNPLLMCMRPLALIKLTMNK